MIMLIELKLKLNSFLWINKFHNMMARLWTRLQMIFRSKEGVKPTFQISCQHKWLKKWQLVKNVTMLDTHMFSVQFMGERTWRREQWEILLEELIICILQIILLKQGIRCLGHKSPLESSQPTKNMARPKLVNIKVRVS